MSCGRDPGHCWRIRCQLGKRCIESDSSECISHPGREPALTDEQWSVIRDRVNDYAMSFTEAANHQSASKADIAQAAALSALQKVRMVIEAAMETGRSRP